jgi:benzoate 4-monooxygenase
MSNIADGEYAETDALRWLNYLAFDIIGDLAFGAPFGMLERGQDMAEVRLTPDKPVSYAPAIEVLNRRGEVSGYCNLFTNWHGETNQNYRTLGCLPTLKPYAKWLPDPFFSKGMRAIEDLAGIAVARVNDRLENRQSDRVDLLARLMEARDAKGDPMGLKELTAEALTQLIAGSDTTSNTSCAMLYHVLQNPDITSKLQKELDSAISFKGVPSFLEVRDLP